MIKTYAKINSGLVTNLILATEEDIVLMDGKFIECSIDESIRYNYPHIGASYDENNDAFINKSPHEDWVLNNETFKWESPIAKPEGAHYWSNGAWQPIVVE